MSQINNETFCNVIMGEVDKQPLFTCFLVSSKRSVSSEHTTLTEITTLVWSIDVDRINQTDKITKNILVGGEKKKLMCFLV